MARFHATTRPVLDGEGNQIGYEQINVPFTAEEEAEWDEREVQVAASFLPNLKDSLMAEVDTHIAGLYAKWARFRDEYDKREAAARTFKAANYNGDPGIYVTRFAGNAGMTNQQAADLIITQADACWTALDTLGALRMDKYLIQAAATEAAARATYAEIIAAADAAVIGL